ncbi:sigma-E factor negative regulatory protein [Neisseria sp.]|uniref:sigma-E factor negative regulatory protein n=1 Tax=Neisseria sp. TaxID=192066 RepID=UPI0026DC37C7|nr:sigma-E factor negative regulatory protein [Neisseria sp.]MDO4906214.1 sigma-E factor negative regulatory protein [Neisseria sp.]
MNQNKDYEFVSAAMDDDSLSEEVLDKLLSDSEAQQRWHEYHLIRDCLQRMQSAARQENAEGAKAGVQTVVAKPFGSTEHSFRPAANHAFKGFAVAASVLAVAVGVWQFWPQSHNGVAAVAEKAAPSGRSGIVSVGGGKAVPAKNDAVANAEAQGTVVPNAARAEQAADAAKRQSAVRVEKLPEAKAASAATK